jgi:phosphatidylserine decarboxylase
MASDIMESVRSVFVPIHPEGWRFIGIFAAVTLIVGYFWSPFLLVGGVLTVWCTYFFRNPERVTPVREGLVVSPADGVVQLIQRAAPPPELEMGDAPLTRVSVFMNVFNVHVNRAPADGRIEKLAYRPGKFFNASLDKASEHNERQSVRMKLSDGRDIAFVQIAGLVARRILIWVSEGQKLAAGERFGMIRFGSRVDVYLPEGVSPLVCVGQVAIAGETVIADLAVSESPREGEQR